VNCIRFSLSVASFAAVAWIVGSASGMAQQASSSSKKQASTEAVYKGSKDYLMLSAEKTKEVRATTMKFYGKSELPKFNARGIKEGHVGNGVISFEAPDNTELRLDVDPCNGNMELFHEPYEKHELDSKVTCNGKEYTYYSVEQKKKQK
jgi:hypothetical protein